MGEDIAEDFKSAIREGLRTHKDSLIAVLQQLVQHIYPSEVVAVDFEVFPEVGHKGFRLVPSF